MVRYTKLPPGKAEGADDLRTWSSRRAAGMAGVGDKRDKKQDPIDAWIEAQMKQKSGKGPTHAGKNIKR